MSAAPDAGYRYCPLCATALVRRIAGERERNVCPACGWVHWDNPAPVVAAVIEYQGQVLLARNAAWPPKMFALVTGFLERDETPQQAVAREVKEETNLDTRAATLIGVYDFARKNELIVAFHVLAEGDVRLSEELADYRLIDPPKLRPWPAATGLALADWMRSRGLTVEFLDLQR
jgi:NADH pyrophosphatase NudC (nudix superfamily)